MQEQHQRPTTRHNQDSNNRLTYLLQQRRNTYNSNTMANSQLSKIIAKEIRSIKGLGHHAKIQKILSDYMDLKRISGIKSQRVKQLIPSMLDDCGTAKYERQSIADVFPTFYEQLYRDNKKHTFQHNPYRNG